VTDQSSLGASPYVNLTAPPVPQPAAALPAEDFSTRSESECAAGGVVCQICGRRGHWVNPFPEVEHDSC
jgi:hypothetical protein